MPAVVQIEKQVDETTSRGHGTLRAGDRLPQAVRRTTSLILRAAFPVSDQQAAGYFLVDEQQIITREAYQDVLAPAVHCRNDFANDARPEPGLRPGKCEILRPIGMKAENPTADNLRPQIPHDDLDFRQFGHFPPG